MFASLIQMTAYARKQAQYQTAFQGCTKHNAGANPKPTSKQTFKVAHGEGDYH